MSDSTTRRMLEVYKQSALPTRFFSGMFQSPPKNFYDAEKIEVDIVRDDEDVAVAVTDVSTGYRMNSADDYTNKEFLAPAFKEAFPLNSYKLYNRVAGQDPFVDPTFRVNILSQMMDGMQKIERKIRRAIELQASQVMTTGKADLTDENGNTIYEIDYKPKATHFPTTGVTWSGALGDPIGDLNSLCEVIRNDGLEDPTRCIMGSGAFENFVQTPAVIQRFDTRRADMGQIVPLRSDGNGGQYRGTIDLGTYKLDIWTYAGRYKSAQTGAKVLYLPTDLVVVMVDQPRLDATFGAIPNIGQLIGGGRMFPELPTRFVNSAGGMDLFTNIWMSVDGENLFGGVGARPLMIPTAIDQFGCLDTVI